MLTLGAQEHLQQSTNLKRWHATRANATLYRKLLNTIWRKENRQNLIKTWNFTIYDKYVDSKKKKKKKSNLKASEIAVCTWFTFSSKSFCRIFCLASSNGSPELRCAKLVGKGSKTGKPIGGVCTTARAKAATTVFLETPILNFPFNHKTRSQIAVYLKRTHYVLRLALPARYK